MGLALATIPLDIAAHHYDRTKNTKKATALHVTVDTLSILNKILFFYNNTQSSFTSRDSLVNNAWMVRDINKLFRHIKILKFIVIRTIKKMKS